MKKSITGLLLTFLFALHCWGSDDWGTDFAKAKTLAAKNNKPILIDFTGSDWCGWCMKLDKEVLSQKEFKEYAAKNLNLVVSDYPKSKKQSDALRKQNQKLAKDFNIEGYPTIILVDKDGKEMARTGYKAGGASEYVNHLKELLAKKAK